MRRCSGWVDLVCHTYPDWVVGEGDGGQLWAFRQHEAHFDHTHRVNLVPEIQTDQIPHSPALVHANY
jgi:hypothetical protein